MRRTLLCLLSFLAALGPVLAKDPSTLDDTGGFIHLSPGLVRTTNGCAEFTVTIQATLTDARVFGLKFSFDESRLELLSVTSGSHPSLNLMPHFLASDTLHVDGFFHPNFPAGQVTIATLRIRAITPGDDESFIGFVTGQGYGGTPAAPELIVLSGDTTYVDIEGTAPLAPEKLVIKTLPYPANDDSVLLSWRPVRRDVDGDTVIGPMYLVCFENMITDTVFEIGSTMDTFYYDDAIRTGANLILYDSLGNPTDTVEHGLYFIRSCKVNP